MIPLEHNTTTAQENARGRVDADLAARKAGPHPGFKTVGLWVALTLAVVVGSVLPGLRPAAAQSGDAGVLSAILGELVSINVTLERIRIGDWE